MTHTHTYAILEVSREAFKEIADKLKEHYAHAFHYDKKRRTILIDMAGLALAPEAQEGEE